MAESLTQSGARVVISDLPPFEDADRLRNCVSRVKVRAGFTDFKSPDAVLELTSDTETEEAFFLCARCATYDGAHVDRRLFDDPKLGLKARRDFIELFFIVLDAAVAPFFEIAFSASKTPPAEKAADPASK